MMLHSVGALYGKPDHKMDIEIIRYFPTKEAMLVEAFIQIPMVAMKFEKGDGEKYRYRLSFTVDLFNEGKKLFHDEWERSGEVSRHLSASERAYIIEPILSLPLEIGGYELHATVRDFISGNIQEFKREIVDPGESRILSDIMLANTIVKDTTDIDEELDIFKKGNLRIHVSPSGNFYGRSPLVFFYYQIRNEDEEVQTIPVQIDILNAAGDVVKELQTRNLVVGPGVQADAGAFSCSGLPVGGYFLRLKTEGPEDSKFESPVVVTKSFNVEVREERGVERKEKGVKRNEYIGFSETQLDSVFSTMRYLLSNAQKSEYRKMNVQGKRSFLHHVWKSLDPIPATDENEFREEHSKRIDYALEEFATVWKAKTGQVSEWAVDDRGVIYIKYGAPDERLMRPNEYGSDPYEIWKYYSTGYAYLFLERIRTQGYELIFTNNRDEVYLPDWERYFPRLTLQDIYRELGAAINR